MKLCVVMIARYPDMHVYTCANGLGQTYACMPMSSMAKIDGAVCALSLANRARAQVWRGVKEHV